MNAVSDDGSTGQWVSPPRPPVPQPQWSSPNPEAPPRPPAPGQPAASVFAAPYATAPRGSFPEPAVSHGRAVGVVALVAAVLAAVGASIVGAIAGFQIGVGVDPAIFGASQPAGDLRVLSPVRSWVLVAEIAFWIGTALGVWAIVQGIVAIAGARGRPWAIAGVVIAVLGPVIFFAAVIIAVTVGAGGGSAVGPAS